MSHLKYKWGLVIKALLIALPVAGLKALFYYLDFEVIAVGPIITALIAGVFFIIAIILSGVFTDYKESEKLPSELAASIETIYKDTLLTGTREVSATMLAHVRELTKTIISNFERKGIWKQTEINNAIDTIDDDLRSLAGKGAPLALILKMRNELGNIKKISNRVEMIKETTFLPAGQAVAQFTMGAALVIMVLLKMEPLYEGLVLTAIVSLILISVVLLIKDMDDPFDGHARVDIKQLYKLDEYLRIKSESEVKSR